MGEGPEKTHLDDFIRRLESVGWVDGARYVNGFREHGLLPSHLIESLVKDSIRRINAQLLSQFSAVDRDVIVNRAFDALRRETTPEKVLEYLRHGVPVNISIKGHSDWSGRSERIKLIDYDNLNNNVFFYLKISRFMGLSTREPDLLLYINGIPIVIVEAKEPTKLNSYKEAISQIRVYERELPNLLRYVQIGVAVGDEEYYMPTLPGSYDARRDAYRWIVEGTDSSDIVQLLRPETLLEFIRYFIYFREGSYGTEKIVARYNQYYATKAIMRRVDDYLRGLDDRNRGLVWQWQGSGKTYIMLFAARTFIDKYLRESPIVFIVVDRRELEDQINKVLSAIKDPQFRSMFVRINRIEELHETLKTIKASEWNPNIIPSPKIYLVTIQKFRRSNEELEGIDSLLSELGREYLEHMKESDYSEYAKLVTELDRLDPKSKKEELIKLGSIKKKHILVLIDEAHRSQYGILATMMRRALPNAVMIGFTGTPVLKYDRNTIREFAYPERGELYLHVYSISDSIRDGFTVPIIYRVVVEGRDIGSEGVRINLSEDEIKELMNDYEECLKSEGDCEKLIQEARISRVILENPRRIEKVARYIVDSLENDLGCNPADDNCKFKAMVVAANRRACVRYWNYLKEFLQERYGDVAKDWVEVVMTYEIKDPEEITRYREDLRKRFGLKDFDEINRKITDKFREEKTPKILIVTDMLLAGFDAPNLRVLYLDKPLFEHRLLQAVTRVNRPFKVRIDDEDMKSKENGIIVDFIGLTRHLVRSMMLYKILAKENPQNVFEEFKKGAIKDVEDEFREFVATLSDVKARLKSVRLGIEGTISINVDELVSTLKRHGRVEVRKQLNDYAADLAMFASASDELCREYPEVCREIKKLLNDIVKVIRMYRSLGTYPEKLKYEDDIKVLSILYGLIITKMSKKDIEVDLDTLRNRLLEYIADRTFVDDLIKMDEIRIDEDALDKILHMDAAAKSLESLTESAGRNTRRVVTMFEEQVLQLESVLKSRPTDPIYKKLYQRLIDVVKRWMMRKIEIKDAVKELTDILTELRRYEESAANEPPTERIAYAVSNYISENYLGNRQVNLRLENTRKVIDKVLSRVGKGILMPSDIKEIKKNLILDIINELRNTLSSETKVKISRDLDRIVDEVVKPYVESYKPSDGGK